MSAARISTGAPMLRITDVWKAFGEESVLRGISLDVRQHEVVVLIGASG